MAKPRDPVDHWLESEYRKLNAGIVSRRRPLATLLAEGEPWLETRDGERFLVERAALDRMAAVTDADERRHLLLPITLHFTGDAANECYVSEELAAAVLRRLEEWEAYPFRDGRQWLPHSLGLELVRRYGGAIQALYL